MIVKVLFYLDLLLFIINCDMENYLRECKEFLKSDYHDKSILMILGNEACDLDSAVSSIVLAYFKKKILTCYDAVLPVLNVKRKDLRLRSEVVFFLEETSISLQELICKDEFDAKQHMSKGKLDVVLVDHNILSVEDLYLKPHVISIFDHHAVDNHQHLQHLTVRIEPVGSCCTLVAEEILNYDPSILDPQVAMLLYGAILLDTVCLDESAKRVTEKDKAIVLKLENILEGISRNEVFQAVQKAKFDVTGFSSEQLLQKDLKIVCTDYLRIAISSVPLLIETFLKADSALNALEHFCVEKNVLAVILMGSDWSKDKKSLRRQIAIFSQNLELSSKISDFLVNLKEPSLELKQLVVNVVSPIVFDQGNVTLTRKFVLPAIQRFCSENTSGVLNLNKFAARNACLENLCLDNINCSLDKEEISGSPTFNYRTETLDFPESPKHTNLMKISLQMQDAKLDQMNIESVNCLPVQVQETDTENKEVMLSDNEEGEKTPMKSTGLRKKISVHPDILHSNGTDDDQKSLSSLSNKSDLDIFSPADDIILPDDVDTPDEIENSEGLESSTSEPIPEMSAAEEFEEERSWKSCFINGEERRIDMKVIEPYKKILSHGGYYGSSRNAIIIFCACYLPNRCRQDYDYVMDNLFLYVLTTLDQLVAEDYILVYLHGATERGSMPSFGWLKRCYQMIDRRLRKNLKGLYLVHPTFWLKTLVIMTRPFISSKFSRKLKFVNNLEELASLIPLDDVCIPDEVKKFEKERFVDS